MKTYGLIGYPLGHSFSAGYFSEKFKKENISETEYLNFPISTIDELPKLIETNTNLLGLNVTIPYKQQVIPFIDQISDAAKEIAAVNCIKINRKTATPYLIGYNTDEYGFRQSLLPLLKKHHTKALILGTGGASKAVVYSMQQLHIDYKLVSRTPDIYNQLSYSDIDKHILEEYLLIINTSPLGMSPKNDTFPDIPYQYLTSNHLLYDLVYNPLETLFLAKGKEKNAIVKNGLEMLHLQAEKAWEIWNSK